MNTKITYTILFGILLYIGIKYGKFNKLTKNYTVLLLVFALTAFVYIAMVYHTEGFVNSVPVSTSTKAVKKECKFDITPYTSGIVKINLADIIPRYKPGLSQHGDINDPEYEEKYKGTLVKIQKLQSILGSLYKNEECENKYIELLTYMADKNYMIGTYTGQGAFAALIFMHQILAQFLLFQYNNKDMYSKLEYIRKYFVRLSDFLINVFNNKKDNKLLLRIVTEVLISIVDNDRDRLESINDGLVKHLESNFDDGFVISEKDRGAKIAHYNAYYMLFLFNILFMLKCANVDFPFAKFKTTFEKVVKVLTDPSTVKGGALYTKKYKDYYSSKFGKPMPKVDNISKASQRYLLAFYKHFYENASLDNYDIENLNVGTDELRLAIQTKYTK